jgi:hypothetical protein
MCNQCTRNAVALLALCFTTPGVSFIPDPREQEDMTDEEYAQKKDDYRKMWESVRESIGTLLTTAIPEDGSTTDEGTRKAAEHLSTLTPYALLAISSYAATMSEALEYVGKIAGRLLQAQAVAGDEGAREALLGDEDVSQRLVSAIKRALGGDVDVIVDTMPLRGRGPRGLAH